MQQDQQQMKEWCQPSKTGDPQTVADDDCVPANHLSLPLKDHEDDLPRYPNPDRHVHCTLMIVNLRSAVIRHVKARLDDAIFGHVGRN